jgi:hypothetical protein
MHGTEECSEYCLYSEMIDRCPVECECAYVREVLNIVREWPKSEALAAAT